jgi:hypothetical protein
VPFFSADLEILKPKLLLLPKQIYKHKGIENLIHLLNPNVLAIPVYQFTATNLNTHLKRFQNQAEQLMYKLEESFPLLVEWIAHMARIRKQNVYRYLVHLQEEFNFSCCGRWRAVSIFQIVQAASFSGVVEADRRAPAPQTNSLAPCR